MKSRNFCMTLWLHRTERCWEEILAEMVDNGTLRFCAYGNEVCPTTGALHYQAYCVFHNPRSIGGVRRLFPESNVEVMQGLLSHNETYCSKESTLTKLGDEPSQGERTDIIGVRDRIVNGARPMDIALTTRDSSELQTVARFNRFFTDLHRESSWRARTALGFQPPKVYIRVGLPDAGKSRYITDEHGFDNVWKWNSTMGKFFDGYCGEPVAVFEDVQKGEIPSLGFLKQLLDGAPIRVPFKCDPYGVTWNATTIYFTSNENPECWFDYPNASHYDALMSRVLEASRVYKDRPPEVFHTSNRFHAQA